MNCHYCGTVLRDGEVFCHYCGTRRQTNMQPEPETVIAAPMAPVCEAPAPLPEVKETPAPRSAVVYKEKTFDWHPYGAPAKEEPLVDIRSTVAPKLQLSVKRSLLKMILFGILTLGIYPFVIWCRLAEEVNLVASRHDGERSMSFFGMLLLTPLTLGIHSLVWMHKLCRRIGSELQRRSINYRFGSNDFWLWGFLVGLLSSGCFAISGILAGIGTHLMVVIWLLAAVGILGFIGPFVFIAKLLKASNLLNADYNING